MAPITARSCRRVIICGKSPPPLKTEPNGPDAQTENQVAQKIPWDRLSLFDKRKVNIESVSESISLIININKKIINLKKSIGNNCTEVKAYKEYHSTLEMRNKLISNYIKIYITLNDNPIENELAKIFKEYIDKIHVDFNFNKISEFDLENIEKQLMDLSRKTINF